MQKIILIGVLFLMQNSAFPCDKGCTQWEGVCACDAPHAKEMDPTPVVVPSDEKPPKNPQACWETGACKTVVIQPYSTTQEEDQGQAAWAEKHNAVQKSHVE